MGSEKQHIVLINQHYWPDNAATALALTDLASYLSSSNYKVSVISSRYLYDHSGNELDAFETQNDVSIYRVKQTNFGRYSHKGRLRDYASFFIRALFKSFLLKPDIIITLTTPPLLGTIGWAHKLARQVKFIYWAMDLHPEAEIAVSMISKGSKLAKLITSFHEKILASADAIVALSSNMKSILSNYQIDSSKIKHISIWSDSQEIQPQDSIIAKSDFSKRIQSSFVVHYSGNLGLAHNYQSLLSVIKHSTDESVLFVFTGGGPQMPVLKKEVEKLGLKNVEFQPYVDRSELSRSLAKADIQWFSLDPSFEGIAYPSKLIGYMASGRPILFLGTENADSAKVIEQASCGYSFTINDYRGVLSAISKLKEHPELRNQLGINARNYFEKELTREKCCADWLNVVEAVNT